LDPKNKFAIFFTLNGKLLGEFWMRELGMDLSINYFRQTNSNQTVGSHSLPYCSHVGILYWSQFWRWPGQTFPIWHQNFTRIGIGMHLRRNEMDWQKWPLELEHIFPWTLLLLLWSHHLIYHKKIH
jgi:hypothetical protein